MDKICPPFDATTGYCPDTHVAIDKWDARERPDGSRYLLQRVVLRQDAAIARNNEKAGEARLAWLTDVAGQAQTYEAKRAEAERWEAAGMPDEADVRSYPWAADRASRLGRPVAEVLGEWLARAKAWTAAGILIEAERERVNAAISAAAGPEEIEAALSSAAYPPPA